MPYYETEGFEPPAPVAIVTLRNPSSGVSVADVTMLLDTGADVTLIPRFAAEKLGCDTQIITEFALEGYDGSRNVAEEVHLQMLFLGKAFTGQFLLTETPSGILGRNILNHLRLILDGPRLLWDEANINS